MNITKYIILGKTLANASVFDKEDVFIAGYLYFWYNNNNIIGEVFRMYYSKETTKVLKELKSSERLNSYWSKEKIKRKW